MEMHEYKCPCCGGSIVFDSGAQKMKCPYCDTEFDVETLAAYDQVLSEQPADDMTWDPTPGCEWDGEEDDGVRVYVCESCGGEIICDENTAATSCPFCGSPVIIMGKLQGMLKPDYVIPFKLDKKAAKEKLMSHLGGKRLGSLVTCYHPIKKIESGVYIRTARVGVYGPVIFGAAAKTLLLISYAGIYRQEAEIFFTY